MFANVVKLRQEVFEIDAWKIADWLEDDEVIRYLNEGQNISKSIRQVICRINVPVLTHLFNQNGSFFMVTNKEEPIGYLKLIPKGKTIEMVVIIGDKKQWGKGFGSNAIYQGLKHAFFVQRMDKVIAKIHIKNERSISVFRRIGFKKEKELTKEILFSISIDQFLKSA